MERTPRPAAGLDAGEGVRLGADGWTARLERWAAEARVDDAARSRARERELRRQAEEGATLAGVLADLAETGSSVRVQLRGGRAIVGVVAAVGDDVVVVQPAVLGHGPAVAALPAVTGVRAGPAARPVAGDRGDLSGLRLVDVLADLAAEREHVRLLTADGDAFDGCLRSLGRDVVALTCEVGAGAGAVHVSLAALVAVLIGG